MKLRLNKGVTSIILKDELPAYVQAIKETFINRDNNYIKQRDSGAWDTLIAGTERHNANGGRFYVPKLRDSHIRAHLKNTATYGVKCTNKTKFIVFDFDDRNLCRQHFATILETLIQEGIPANNIYGVFSGSKGYHMHLYFSEEVPLHSIKTFYKLILAKAGLYGSKDVIELRPTDTQGVKLPIGEHKATGRICTYVNPFDLEQTLPPSTLLNLNKTQADLFFEVVERLSKTVQLPQEQDKPAKPKTKAKRKAKVEMTIENMNDFVKPPEVYKLGADEEFTLGHLQKLYDNGIPAVSTRDFTTFKLAIYFKEHYGMDVEEVKAVLVDWIKRQDTRLYTTDPTIVVAETVKKVEHVFNKDYKLIIRENELSLTEAEINAVLQATKTDGKQFTAKQKSVLYALLIHCKRYGSGNFFMTYKQIREATGITNDRIISKTLTMLNEAGLLTYIRKQERAKGEIKCLPNIYSLPFVQTKTATDGNSNGISVAGNKFTDFKAVVNGLYTPKELRKALPRNQVNTFIA